MATFSVTNTFVVNSTAKSSEVNRNFTDVLTILQAHHHDPNIYTNASPITNSGIAANAQIRDTQLYSQITRSGLVNQSALGQITSPGIIQNSALPGGIKPIVRTYLNAASPATWNKPSNLAYIVVEVQAAGGNGGTANNDVGGGGGGGGYARKIIDAASLGATETVTIGAVGASSSFGSHCSATPGSNGSGNTAGGGGTGSGGDINVDGGGGAAGGAGATGSGSNNGMGSGTGGSSFFGAGGRGVTTGSTGGAGGAYGGGGAGGAGSGAGNQAGGAGGPAIVIVTEYYGY